MRSRIVLALTIGLTAMTAFGGDDELIKLVPESLKYERKQVPDDQNAFLLLRQTAEKVIPADHEIEWLGLAQGVLPTEKLSACRELVDKNRAAFETLRQAFAYSRCQLPLTASGEKPIPYLSKLKSLSRTNGVRVKLLAMDGEFERAIDASLESVRLGELIASGEGGAIELLVGASIHSSGLFFLQWLTLNKALPDARALRLIDDLRTASPFEAAAELVVRREFQDVFVRQVLSLPENPSRKDCRLLLFDGFSTISYGSTRSLVYHAASLHRGLFDRKATFESAIPVFERLSKNATTPWPQRNNDLQGVIADAEKVLAAEHAEIEQIIGKVGEGLRSLQNPDVEEKLKGLFGRVRNIGGRALIPYLFGPLDRLDATMKKEANTRAATQTIIALRLYFDSKSTLPESLQRLVDERFLPAIPIDAFTGKPMLYSAEERKVWSVGRDGKDDGGARYEDDSYRFSELK